MSDAETIAKMTPEQLATALGGELIIITHSACDVCEKPSVSESDKRYVINFRAGDEAQSGLYCLACLQSLCFHSLREQARMDALVEGDGVCCGEQRIIEREGCAS